MSITEYNLIDIDKKKNTQIIDNDESSSIDNNLIRNTAFINDITDSLTQSTSYENICNSLQIIYNIIQKSSLQEDELFRCARTLILLLHVHKEIEQDSISISSHNCKLPQIDIIIKQLIKNINKPSHLFCSLLKSIDLTTHPQSLLQSNLQIISELVYHTQGKCIRQPPHITIADWRQICTKFIRTIILIHTVGQDQQFTYKLSKYIIEYAPHIFLIVPEAKKFLNTHINRDTYFNCDTVVSTAESFLQNIETLKQNPSPTHSQIYTYFQDYFSITTKLQNHIEMLLDDSIN